MRFRVIALVCGLGTTGIACQVNLRAHSEVLGPSIRLSDIADIHCPGEPNLAKVELGDAANFGLTRVMDVDRLQSTVLSPWQGRMVLIAPGRSLHVTTASDTLGADQLEAMVDSLFALERLSPRMQRRVQVIKSPQAITLPKTNGTVELFFSSLKRKGKVPLELRIGKSGKVVRTVPVSVDVRISGPVAVAKNLVRRGETFTTQNIYEEIKDITGISASGIPSMIDCLGKQASQTVTAGRMLTLRLVNMPPLFHKGERVPLVMQQGNIQVAIHAVARRDGRVGEVIPVWNPANHKMVHATVQKDGTLKLIAEGG
jgi:flagellar basal body P-ring formation protein FlgA